MLSLNRKTDYALVALADMADRPDEWASAREIAERSDVPPALLMNVLKTLHGGGILRSTRGSRGGYRIAADLERLSLFDLVKVLEATEATPDANVNPQQAAQFIGLQVRKFRKPLDIQVPFQMPGDTAVVADYVNLERERGRFWLLLGW